MASNFWEGTMTHFICMTTAILFKLAVKQRTILLVVFATDGDFDFAKGNFMIFKIDCACYKVRDHLSNR